MRFFQLPIILFVLFSNIFSMNEVLQKIGADYYHDRGNYGGGCIIGLFDPSSYLDITNSVFRNTDGSTRFIYYLWTSLQWESDTLECSREQLDSILADYPAGSGKRWVPFDTSSVSYDTTYNGSHPLSTLFCAAGGEFIHNDTVYQGVAPNADLVYFGYGDISACVRKLDSLSDVYSKPFVFATVNAAAVAWNIDTITGEGKPGKAAFLPTGNSNEIDYTDRYVSKNEPLIFSFSDIQRGFSSSYSSSYFGTALWVYNENTSDSHINVEVSMPNGETYVFPENSPGGKLLASGGNVYINTRKQNFNVWSSITAPDEALDSDQHWTASWQDSTIDMIAIDGFHEDTLSTGFYEEVIPCVYMEIAYLGDTLSPFEIKITPSNENSESFMRCKFNELRYLTNTVPCCAEDYYYYKPGGLENKYSMTPSAWPREGIACGAYIFRDDPEDSLDRIAPFSGVGPSPDGLIKPDIVGPGTRVNILWVDNLYQDPYIEPNGGTSLSTPIAAGAAALLLTENPSLSAPQIKQIFRERADTIGISNEIPGNIFGHGRLYISPEPALAQKKKVPAHMKTAVHKIYVSKRMISISSTTAVKSVRIYDTQGRIIDKTDHGRDKTEIKMPLNFSNGLYILEIIGESRRSVHRLTVFRD